MKNIIRKIQKNPLYFLIPIAFISFLLININVVYFGDDYGYLEFKNLNIDNHMSKLISHYFSTNGRFIVHLLVTLFLKLPMIYWQLFNSFMLTCICYFSTKLLTRYNSKKSPIIFGVIFFLISALNITVTNQSVYWLTGSFNYVYPLFIFFIYWDSLYKLDTKNNYVPTIILGLLSSASVEQASMMTFGLTLLTLLSKISSFKNITVQFKNNIKLIILCFVTLIGACTVLLSPSQFVRINNEEAQTQNVSILERIIENTKKVSSVYTVKENIFPFCLLFNTFSIIYIFQKGDRKSKILISLFSMINFTCTIINIYIIARLGFPIYIKHFLGIIILLCYAVTFIYLNKHIYNSLINVFSISGVLLVGSQAMMLVSPIFGYRNALFGLVMFAFIIMILAQNINFNYKSNILIGLVTLGVLFNIKTSIEYAQTKKINEENINIIHSNQEIISNPNGIIELQKFPSNNHYWSVPYISPWHNDRFKDYYNIKCEILWK